MNIYMTIYAVLFWAFVAYAAINGKNEPYYTPFAVAVAIMLPVPFILQAMGVI